MDFQVDSLVDKLSAVKVDVLCVARSVKVICRMLENDGVNISIRTRHRLCRALAINYFILLEQETNFPEILSYIRISLTCMSILKQSSISSNILCQALLERSLTHGYLFNDNITSQKEELDMDILNDDWIKLSEENHKATLGHRFRRLPNHSRTSKLKPTNQLECPKSESNEPDKKSINTYLLNEAFKSSINNIEAFANLFVEFHCPVTFDKVSWPNDEALRVTNEKNLSILRRFEQIPPFWDLYELIGQAGCLGSCLTLVKALFTANLALWSSATTNSQSDKMSSTVRLIPPLAQSGLIPKSFGKSVGVFPHFAPTEVFAVLTDIWLYLKDSKTFNINTNGVNNQSSLQNDKLAKTKAKIYLNRLRLFMCQHTPGKEYVTLFRDFYEEPAVDSSNP